MSTIALQNSILNLMQSIKENGIQPSTNYTFIIESSDGTAFDLSNSAIEIIIPGPKYEFYTNTYWRGNWEYKQPAGIKYEDLMVCRFMVPVKTSGVAFNGLPNNLFNFLDYNKNRFQYPRPGSTRALGSNVSGAPVRSAGTASFRWLYPNQGGYAIRVIPLDRNGNPLTDYYFINCFVEKVLPFVFSAEPESPIQTMQIAFTIGAEMNKL